MTNKQILIVDDQEINRLILSKILKKTWYTNITTASNWVEAIKIATNNSIDIVFMDIEMPIMDWIRATKYIKDITSKTKKRIKIIWLSWHSDDITLEEWKRNWMDWFIIKPFRIENIISYINNAD